MRLALAKVAVAVLVIGVLAVLANATKNRRDQRVPGTVTTVEFEVSTHGYRRGVNPAAEALWAICSAQVSGDVSPAPVLLGDRWTARISPAIGEHGENRLVGCLEDLTIDRVVGDVLAIRTSS